MRVRSIHALLYYGYVVFTKSDRVYLGKSFVRN